MLNIPHTRSLLQSFDFKTLFIEELGWNNASSKKPAPFKIQEQLFYKTPIAELSGALVLEITAETGEIPDTKTRALISVEMQKLHFEHILIFINKEKTDAVWRWLKKQDKKTFAREHFYSKYQSGDLFIAKLANLVTDISELENDLTIVDVANKLKKALDVEKVTQKFYKEYQDKFELFKDYIEGIDSEADRKWYTSVVLNRLMFIYFLQKKLFLDNGNATYLSSKLEEVKRIKGEDHYFSFFLQKLFFEGFAKPENERSPETNALIGYIKYLNGGLFIPHKIEIKYQGKIAIKDKAFELIFALFETYSWSLDDNAGGKDNEINPDVLGHIFEKYINQKAFGAYYTRPEITEYLCRETVEKIILDQINLPTEGLENAKFVDEKTKKALAPKIFRSLDELTRRLDAPTCEKLLKQVLPKLSLLDPACGSGAFLVAAMKVLVDVYAPILGKIDFLGNEALSKWKKEALEGHPNMAYYIKKQIITNNIYGVDIMEEATEIAKLRLFLALVSSINTVDELEPLPNIDFNIMPGNSLIGLMRVDDMRFGQLNIFHQSGKSYADLVREKENLIGLYKAIQNTQELQLLRQSIDSQREEAFKTLNQLLLGDFMALKIGHEEIEWDDKLQDEAKKHKKRALTPQDIQNLKPFHWAYEFSDIFRAKNGFDAIITNPPWDILKPNDKEFFAEYSEQVFKKKMDIKEFEAEKKKLLQNADVRKAWLQYKSQFLHQSSYFTSAKQYENQISYVEGKKQGSDINLYKLFTEQCYNLLRPGGYCGTIIPSGIYTDLGTKQLRLLLLEKTQISNLFSFANEKFIFKAVDHRFKFCFLSFKKEGKTEHFQAAFRINPREAVTSEDLPAFFEDHAQHVTITNALIRQLMPESLSVIELRTNEEAKLIEKMLQQPKLGDKSKWNIQLGAEFHMTSDSYLFHKENGPGRLPLYEGKMTHQFAHLQTTPKYWVNEEDGRKSLLGKQKEEGQLLDYQRYRLSLRAIARSSDSRTMIASILPQNVFCGNSLLVTDFGNTKKEASAISNTDQLFLVAILNSLLADYFIRRTISANLNMFFIYQTPVPRLSAKDKWYKAIVERAGKLICTAPEFADLWEEALGTKWQLANMATTDYSRNVLLAELDGIIAHLYGLSEEEFTFVLNTFPLLDQAQRIATQNAYRDVVHGVIKP